MRPEIEELLEAHTGHLLARLEPREGTTVRFDAAIKRVELMLTTDQPAAPDEDDGLLVWRSDLKWLIDDIDWTDSSEWVPGFRDACIRMARQLELSARNEGDALKAFGALHDSCNAPDEDAAVRDEAEQLWAIMCPRDSSNPHGIDWARNAIAAGYTRRPVDTRPTRRLVADLSSWDDAGYEVEDPAPAAEVPVFASVEEAEAWLDGLDNMAWGVSRNPSGTWSLWAMTSAGSRRDFCRQTQLEALQALANAIAANGGRDAS